MTDSRRESELDKLCDRDREEELVSWQMSDGTSTWQTRRQVRVWMENEIQKGGFGGR